MLLQKNWFSCAYDILSVSSACKYIKLLYSPLLIINLIYITRVLPCSLYYQDTATLTPSVFETDQHKK